MKCSQKTVKLGSRSFKNFIITPHTNNRGGAWLESTSVSSKQGYTFTRIKRMIFPPGRLKGEEYGTYGGYDAALLELVVTPEMKEKDLMFACLANNN